MSTVCQRVKHYLFLFLFVFSSSIIFVLFPNQKENMCSSWKSLIRFFQGRLKKLCALLMWQSYHVHCYHTLYDAADIVITSVTFIQSQLLDVGWQPKDDSWSRGAKKTQRATWTAFPRWAICRPCRPNISCYQPGFVWNHHHWLDYKHLSYLVFRPLGKWFSGHRV